MDKTHRILSLRYRDSECAEGKGLHILTTLAFEFEDQWIKRLHVLCIREVQRSAIPLTHDERSIVMHQCPEDLAPDTTDIFLLGYMHRRHAGWSTQHAWIVFAEDLSANILRDCYRPLCSLYPSKFT